MKKTLKYMAVLLVVSGASAVNAAPILATSSGASGTVTVTGFADGTPNTIDMLLDYTSGGTTTINVTAPLTAGNLYNFASSFALTGFGSITPSFDVAAQSSVGVGAPTLDAFFSAIFPATVSGAPLGVFTIGSSSLELLSVTKGTDGGGHATLLLSTHVLSGNISATLTSVAIGQGHPGTALTTFNNGNISVTAPEPTAFLLLGAGLLGFVGFSKRRA